MPRQKPSQPARLDDEQRRRQQWNMGQREDEGDANGDVEVIQGEGGEGQAPANLGEPMTPLYSFAVEEAEEHVEWRMPGHRGIMDVGPRVRTIMDIGDDSDDEDDEYRVRGSNIVDEMLWCKAKVSSLP